MMEWIAIAIFAITIVIVIANVVDSTVAALRASSRWLDRHHDRDRRVLARRLERHGDPGQRLGDRSYFGKTGIPSWLSVQALRLSGRRPGVLVTILSALAGAISMFVDNVVVILMMAPVALPLAPRCGCRSPRSS